MRKIAIFRALYLGDMLLAVPALRAIRRHFVDAEITLIGLPWAESFTRRFGHYLDRFVAFEGYAGIDEVEFEQARSTRFVEEQKAYGYDVVVQMHGSGRTSNAAVLALGGKMTVGYHEDGLPEQLTLEQPYPDAEPEICRNLELARLLGCLELDTQLEFPLFAEERREAAKLLRKLPRTEHPWIGIHAGAKMSTRRWPAEYFARVADDLAERWRAQIIVTGELKEEALVQAVIAKMRTQPLYAVGKTSLGGLAALIGQMDLFISNDTGPAHMAYALNTPSVTIFGPTEPRRWAALDTLAHPFVRGTGECGACTKEECLFEQRCLREVRPEKVMEVAEALLLRGSVA
ncbi:MAG: glycosyltransferase family 9 protein [Ktedonobacteraceae bacterium]